MVKLRTKQEFFCQEYLKDFNGKQAAIRAGYSKKTAEVQASYLLSNPKVSQRMAELKKELTTRNNITADMVIEELALIAFQDSANLVDDSDRLKTIHKMGSDVSRTIAEVTSRIEVGKGDESAEIKKVKTYDKKGALELLGRHLGIFEKDNRQRKIDIDRIERVIIDEKPKK